MCDYLISLESVYEPYRSATRHFKHGDAIKIGRGIIHTQDCHIYIYSFASQIYQSSPSTLQPPFEVHGFSVSGQVLLSRKVLVDC